MTVPTCVEWLTIVGSGVLTVPLLELLKRLPRVGAIVAQWAAFLAMVLPAFLAAAAQEIAPVCGRLDPLLWVVIYAGAAYLLSQLTYWLSRRSGMIAAGG